METLETRERLLAQRVSLAIEIGIRDLDNRRTADHKDFLATTDRLIKEISTLKDEFNASLDKKYVRSKQLVDETHNAYESSIAFL